MQRLLRRKEYFFCFTEVMHADTMMKDALAQEKFVSRIKQEKCTGWALVPFLTFHAHQGGTAAGRRVVDRRRLTESSLIMSFPLAL